jgi:probable F420-dependent oxidoreductase
VPGRPAFRFGVEVATARDAAEWRDTARAVEELGYSTLLTVDHFGDQLAPVPAMVAAAAATTTLRVGSHVLAGELRNPALLAKEAATVDMLTEGRLELGIGAGWNQAEHDGIGVRFPAPGTRVERLGETLTVLKGLLGNDSFSFAGRHHRVTEVAVLPRPVQRPRPPIMVGGGGRDILSLAAREADIVSLNANLAGGRPADAASMTAAATARKIGWIRSAASHRPTRPVVGIRVYYTVVTNHAASAAAAVGERIGMAAEDVLASPHLLVGDVPSLVAELEEYRERFGISYIVVTADSYRDFAPVVARLS